MPKGRVFGIGMVTGVAMWATGSLISRAALKDRCAQEPFGHCWNSHDAMSGFFNTLGERGITPAFALVTFICLVLLSVATYILGKSERGSTHLVKGMLAGVLLAACIGVWL